jgi:DNA-binding beta-propeller fold protein YncE
VAAPGVRNYTEHGGVGVLVFDMDDRHRFVRRIPTPPVRRGDTVENVKGVCACARTARLYVSTIRRLLCIDLLTDRLLWDREYPGGCDRMSITPDGSQIYLPSLEGPHWHVVDGGSGEILTRIEPNSGAHNTVVGLDGRFAYLAGLKSPLLRVVETATNRVVREVGPFGNVIRPFTVNGRQTRCFVNVNDLLGFEVGDLRSGRPLHRVEVKGFSKGPVKRHGCPSHGVGLTPDEREIWVCDAANQRLHLFDAGSEKRAPRQTGSIALVDEPGWVTFSLDGRTAYPSTGEVIDVASRRVVGELWDETGRVMSEKMVEIVFRDGKPVRNGDQFGLGRAT